MQVPINFMAIFTLLGEMHSVDQNVPDDNTTTLPSEKMLAQKDISYIKSRASKNY